MSRPYSAVAVPRHRCERDDHDVEFDRSNARVKLSSGSSQDRVTYLACSNGVESCPCKIFDNRDVEPRQRQLVQSQHNFGYEKSCADLMHEVDQRAVVLCCCNAL